MPFSGWPTIEVHDDQEEATDAYNFYLTRYSGNLDVRLVDSESKEVLLEARAR